MANANSDGVEEEEDGNNAGFFFFFFVFSSLDFDLVFMVDDFVCFGGGFLLSGFNFIKNPNP